MKAAETDLAPSERLFVTAGPQVRIRLAPAASLRTLGPPRDERPDWVYLRLALTMASQAGVARSVFGRSASATPAAFASSSRMGAPRLQEWMAIREAALRTNKISSREAPASSAVRMWRRVPSGLRLVQAAFNPIPTNSINLRGRTPEFHGLVVILVQ